MTTLINRALATILIAWTALPGSADAATCTPKGDLNQDGSQNITDIQCQILSTLAFAAGDAMPTCVAGSMEDVDIDCDGSLTVSDIILNINATLGIVIDAELDGDGDGCVDACAVPDAPFCEAGSPLATVVVEFEEGSGTTAANTAAAGTSAVLHGGAAFTDSGHEGGGVSLNGSGNSAVRLPMDSLRGDAFSVAVRVRPTTSGNRFIFSASHEGAEPDNGLALSLTGDLWFAGSKYSSSGSWSTPTNVWTHYAVVYDGAELRVYRDGALLDEHAVSADVSWTGDLWLGQEQDCLGGCFDGSQQFLGQLDDLHWYDVPLPPNQVAAVADGGHLCADGCGSDGNLAGFILDFSDEDALAPADASANGTSAYTQGGVEIDPDGVVGPALRLTGASSSALRIDTAELSTDAFSLAMWVRPEVQGNRFFLSLSKTTGTKDNGLAVSIQGDVWFGGAHKTFAGAWSTPTNQWTHYAVVYDGASLRIYKDSALIATHLGYADLTWGSDLFVGQEQDCNSGCFDPSQAFIGSVDEVQGFNLALTPEDVATLFQASPVCGGCNVTGEAAAYRYTFADGDVSEPTDASGNETMAFTQGNATATDDGYVGGGLYLAGSGSSALRIDTTDFATDAFSVAMWLKPAAGGNRFFLSLSKATGTKDNGLAVSIAGDVWFGGSHKTNAGAWSTPTGVWTHYAVVYSGTDLRIYRNGALLATHPGTADLTWASDLFIGQEQDCNSGCFDPTQAFVGTVDEVQGFHFALTPDEVASLVSSVPICVEP